MKIKLISAYIIILIIVSFPLYGKNVLYVSINYNDCPNCSKIVYNLDKLKTNYDIVFVLKEKYKSDSLFIDQTFQYSSVGKLLFNDSLYHALSPDDISKVTLTSSYNVGHVSSTIQQFYQSGFHNYLNTFTKPIDTLLNHHGDVSLLGVQRIMVQDGNLYLPSTLKKEISVYNVYTRALRYKTPQLSKADMRKIFANNPMNYPVETHGEQLAIMSKYKIPSIINYMDIAVNQDSIYVVLYHLYATFINTENANNTNSKVDTTFNYIFSHVTFEKDKIVGIHNFEHDVKINGSHIWAGTGLAYDDNHLYLRLGHIKDQNFAKRPYMSTVSFNKQNKAIIHPFYDRIIPQEYKYEESYAYMSFFKGTYIFNSLPIIYSLRSGIEVEKMDFMEPNGVIDFSKDFNLKSLCFAYAISQDYVWAAVSTYNPTITKVYKMHRKSRKTSVAERSFARDDVPMTFDAINPDYLIYIDDNDRVIREQLFQ